MDIKRYEYHLDVELLICYESKKGVYNMGLSIINTWQWVVKGMVKMFMKENEINPFLYKRSYHMSLDDQIDYKKYNGSEWV